MDIDFIKQSCPFESMFKRVSMSAKLMFLMSRFVRSASIISEQNIPAAQVTRKGLKLKTPREDDYVQETEVAFLT